MIDSTVACSTEADLDLRVLLIAPTARDAAAGHDLLLSDGVACKDCCSVRDLCAEIRRGAGAVILPEEAVVHDDVTRLTETLHAQPPWSDLPVIVLTVAGRTPDRRIRMLLDLGNVTLVKRPLEVQAFLNSARAALRDRRRQYQVRDHLQELARQAEALQLADRRKDEFLAMLAHELRNPLAPIRNGLQILRIAHGDLKTVADTREMMDRQVQHLARLVDDLLDVSRITRGKVELRKEAVDMIEILARAAEIVQPALDARGQRLTVQHPGRPVWVNADVTRMTQVIGNLLSNAGKYSDDGNNIRLNLELGAAQAVVRIVDSGVGIAAEMLPKVFDLFIQADRTLDRSQGGLGVGLTLARSLVELHGGSVIAFSEGLGKGSEFVMTLPLLPDEAPRRPPLLNGSAASKQRHRILVVDDNVDAAESLAHLLRLFGHEVRTVHNGLNALVVAHNLKPNVALLDLGLPGIDGFELARRFRREYPDNRLLLIALTGYGQDEDRRRTADAGFDHHLVKPADLEEVQRILAEVKSEPRKENS